MYEEDKLLYTDGNNTFLCQGREGQGEGAREIERGGWERERLKKRALMAWNEAGRRDVLQCVADLASFMSFSI